ncbi:uncharacterized protein LOC133303675 [Gastrolobium bilobum]|uniref:uncharacterized protein LOC133303675 n=1 Tax=Gastrolobium bilobum TaxID=150636 RepID=UPI002AB1108A|nr:uncharacterized protein LOC133303675 [Gastrolobium bilobum]
MVWEESWKNLIVESDPTSGIAILSKNGVAPRESHLVARIRAWFQKDWRIHLVHRYKEENHCADSDWLANYPLDNLTVPNMSVFCFLPFQIQSVLIADLAFVYRVRTVSVL